MRLPRLPIPAPPARHETVVSYLTRLAVLHRLPTRELWEPVSTPRPGTNRRDIDLERLAALTGRPGVELARALPELRSPAPAWGSWRHQSQPRCPRCDARHDGGPVHRLLPQHRYVCTRHRYWIGPPDAGQAATALDHPEQQELVRAQWRHLRLVHQRGAAAAFDAVLTSFLICGHLWADHRWQDRDVVRRWIGRCHLLIPTGRETEKFSASRVFAAVYPEAVALAEAIAAPTWRHRAGGNKAEQAAFVAHVGHLLRRPDYQPPEHGDAIAHWMAYDSWQPPSRPHTTYPQTREHGATRMARVGENSLDRHARSATWFAVHRRAGAVILHHRHIRPVLVRDWSTPMDGIQATIWATQSTSQPVHRPDPAVSA